MKNQSKCSDRKVITINMSFLFMIEDDTVQRLSEIQLIKIEVINHTINQFK